MFHKTYMLHSQSPCLAHQIFNIQLIRDWNRKVYLSKMPPQGGGGSPVSSNPSQCAFSPGVFSRGEGGVREKGGTEEEPKSPHLCRVGPQVQAEPLRPSRLYRRSRQPGGDAGWGSGAAPRDMRTHSPNLPSPHNRKKNR